MKKSIQKSVETASAEETKAIAKDVAKKASEYAPKSAHALVVALHGELGSGKTTFAQGFAYALGVEEKVLSPTFVMVKSYALDHKDFKTLYHIDCYRMSGEQDLKRLGWDTIVSDPKNVVLIEWPERVKNILPPSVISLEFLSQGENLREIRVTM